MFLNRGSFLGNPFRNAFYQPVRGLAFWSWSERPKVEFNHITPTVTSTKFPFKDVPKKIQTPSYAESGNVIFGEIPAQPVIWGEKEIIQIRESCILARRVLEEVKSSVAPGVTTDELDSLAREFIFVHGAYPSPLNFKGFPKSISTSVNNCAAHGIPDSRPLLSGDILNIDVTVFKGGFHGDCSDTVRVGEVDHYGKRLIRVTEEALRRGVSECKPGQAFRRIGHVIHKHARAHNTATIPHFLGHGIGTFFHGPPDIYHCLNNYPGVMRQGMVFTIEPCISEGDRRVKILDDGWSAVTMDGARTAQSEHTVLITKKGVEVLTQK